AHARARQRDRQSERTLQGDAAAIDDGYQAEVDGVRGVDEPPTGREVNFDLELRRDPHPRRGNVQVRRIGIADQCRAVVGPDDLQVALDEVELGEIAQADGA